MGNNLSCQWAKSQLAYRTSHYGGVAMGSNYLSGILFEGGRFDCLMPSLSTYTDNNKIIS